MRIALVIANYDSEGGGAERWTDRHARMLLDRGHDVDLVARQFRGVPVGANCHVVDVGNVRNPQARLVFAEQAERLLRNLKVDAIHDMGEGWYADLFMPHHGTRTGGFHQNTQMLPVPVRWMRRLAHDWLPRYRVFRELERRQYQPDGDKLFIAISQMIRGHMQKYVHVDPARIRVVYNGVDLERHQPCFDPSARQQLRRSLFESERVIFLIVAHNFKLKGLDSLLAAMGRLRRRGHKAGLVVVGSGKMQKYAAIARRNGCADDVRFVGNQPDPAPYYHAADVYVQPTFYDPCSLVVLEALACGLPVITTRHNGASELLRPGTQGFVLDDPADVVTLSDSMERFLDSSFRHEASLAARRLAEQHSLDRNCDELVALYREVANRRQAA